MAFQTWSWWTRSRAVGIGGKTYAGVLDETDAVLLTWDGPAATPTKTTIATGLGKDDHNNPGLIIRPGQPVVAAYTRHNADELIRVKVSSTAIESGVDFTGQPEVTVATGQPTSYAVCWHHGTDLYVAVRMTGSGGDPWAWGFIKSTDGGATFGPVQRLFTSPDQFYGSFTRTGTNGLRVTMSTHPYNGDPPDQTIRYCEIDLSTGAITTSDGTVLGNMNGTGLPFSFTSLETIATPAAGYRTWVYDVSDTAEPEVVWSSFTSPESTIAATGVYHYSRRVAGVWQTQDVCASGTYFSSGEEPYVGGAQLPTGGSGGVVYAARESAGIWTVDRHTTGNNGSTWTVAELGSRSGGTRLARAWPVEQVDATNDFEVLAQEITSWVNFTNHQSTIVGLAPVGGAAPVGTTIRLGGVERTATLYVDGVARAFSVQ